MTAAFFSRSFGESAASVSYLGLQVLVPAFEYYEKKKKYHTAIGAWGNY